MRADYCDFCGSNSLAFVYQPEGSTRGLKVHLCRRCGLVQSTPRIDRTQKRHDAAVSGGADWGNVRYGKGFRTQAAMNALARHVRFDDALTLLDVGSNRGRFAAAFLEAAPKADVTAVEPDERYADNCAELPRTRLVRSRIEDATLADASFDIVHSCHTIEHLAHPFASLKDHARALKSGGLLVLDAPNIALIGGDDILEEWFIDKHLYHFSETTLTRMIEAVGFTILERPDPGDRINLLIVARKTGTPAGTVAADPMEVARADNLIASYTRIRAANCAALSGAAHELQNLRPQRVALWGAGRLFDSLVRGGGYDPSDLALLIDAHLIAHMDSRHGVRLSPPHALSGAMMDVVVVMSRGFADEIVAEVKRLAPKARIILYADLLARARLAKAA
ncbi:MAG TPA: class I SAM-dependent methyltransferase [Rhizomicrobium sp.]|jgi:SAM-dependent methyltransferase|nr:class I SAM-dependent methyltransferase [Rhizomicrobium sp.]